MVMPGKTEEKSGADIVPDPVSKKKRQSGLTAS
jgi:hypothetical protein